MSEVFVGLLTLWFIGLGVATILRQHHQYWNFSRRVVIRLWRRYRNMIIAFILGVIYCSYFFGAH